jgi:hypothetical protein
MLRASMGRAADRLGGSWTVTVGFIDRRCANHAESAVGPHDCFDERCHCSSETSRLISDPPPRSSVACPVGQPEKWESAFPEDRDRIRAYVCRLTEHAVEAH